MADSPARIPLPDEAARRRFTDEPDANFSVIAPAGVGKTTAIVRRVVALARADARRETPRLPRLAVVTYTRKAADEMRHRAALELREQGVGPDILQGFQHAFFGTIHRFCLDLLRQFGPLAGLSPSFEPITDRAARWREFLRGRDEVLGALSPEARAGYARLAPLADVYRLAQELDAEFAPPDPGPPPPVDLGPLLAVEPKGRGAAGITEGQRKAGQWARAWADPEAGPCPLPTHTKGGQDFQALWTTAFQPLREWLGAACHVAAAGLAREFRDFRVARGEIDFDDMVALAAGLLNHPGAGEAIRAEGRSVILDEAQDTDRRQFAVLLGVAGASPGFATGEDPAAVGPPPGRFCLVGDPQQAIYGSRADLATYLAVHDRLVGRAWADPLVFDVTMRCDEAVVAAVNAAFPNILRPGEPGQAPFVALQARPWAGPGTVSRVCLPAADLPEKPTTEDKARAEADAFADWLARTGMDGFGVTDWRQVAILTPRNAWADTFAEALERAGVPVQAHSRAVSRRADPVWAWTAALVRVIACPEDAFEAVGLLREAFAIPDDALLRRVMQSGARAEDGAHTLSPIGDFGGSDELSTALRALRRAGQVAAERPLAEGFDRALDQLDWAARLASLPGLGLATVSGPLERLRIEALLAEEEGLDWRAWSDRLVRALDDKMEEDDPAPGHLQLLSCHKAKGLQWEVVIVSALWRKIGQPPVAYPRLLAAGDGESAVVASDASCQEEAVRRVAHRQWQELERLAYVTWTRARHRLIFVEAEAIVGPASKHSWADFWQIGAGGTNAAFWSALPEFTPENNEPNGDIPSAADPVTPFPFAEDLPLADEAPVEVGCPRRVLPSSLARHGETALPVPNSLETKHNGWLPGFAPEGEKDGAGTPLALSDLGPAHVSEGPARDERDRLAEPGYPEIRSAQAAQAGADYGNWWHATMEHAPWGEDRLTWIAHRDKSLLGCPDVDRAVAEFEQLVTTEEFSWLNAPAHIVRCELPLLWPEGASVPGGERVTNGNALPTKVYDGFIDLLARDESTGAWRVVDWKTDRVGPHPAAELRATYGPQLAAYVEAITAMFGEPVEGWLYSTRAGQWIALAG